MGSGEFLGHVVPPCLGEIPERVALHNAHQNKDLVVLGVFMDEEDPPKVLQFAQHENISYPVILGNAQLAAQVGPIIGLPNSYLYDPLGKLVAHNVGPLTRKAVERFIKENGQTDLTPGSKTKQ